MAQPIPWVTPPLQIPGARELEKNEPVDAVQHAADSSREGPIFRHQREASAIELFYDLFLVANLATVTIKNEIIDARTLKAYIGFFTLLWFTWLQTILFDVRFSTESVFHHAHKVISFAVMIGFVICAATYDTSDVHSTIDGFRAMSVVLMASRLALAIQYAIAFWYVHEYKKTRLPFVCTITSLVVAGMGFFGIFWGIKSAPDCYLACFKHTHLVERLGLLTLIIMGEGIFGLSKTTYHLFQTVKRPDADNFGELVCAVLLVYMIFLLYFGHISHKHFGTIRQQVWMVLHYPLHVAILLTVEGSSFLILSGVIGHITEAWGRRYPLAAYPDWGSFFEGYSNPGEVILNISTDLDALLDLTFKDRATVAKLYNYARDIGAIENISTPFNSTEWQNEAGEAINQLWSGVEVAIYHSFGIEGHDPHDHEPSSIEQVASAQNMMNTVFLYFFFSAGSLLLVLAVMFFFAKQKHSKASSVSIGSRVAIGVGVMLPVLAKWIDNDESNAFYLSPWKIGVVMLAYFLVIVGDRMICAWRRLTCS